MIHKDDINKLMINLDKLHTTKLGVNRIKKNLSLWNIDDVVEWCKDKMKAPNSEITKQGKNWYIVIDGYKITVNATSYTIITAHRLK